MNKHEQNIASLRKRASTKADYLPKTLKEARADFIHRAKETVAKLRDGEVKPYKPAPMAKQQTKTKLFCVKIGYGNNNAYLANTLHTASQVLKYETAQEAADDLENIIIPMAMDEVFDENLAAALADHKERARARLAKRNAGSSDDSPMAQAAE